MQIFITVLILILMLGILICAHEAGHLLFAKIFHVYCTEYSIGFGPKLFRKKRKRGETFFALRAVPLGGYVQMVDEPVSPEDAEALGIPPDLPKERTLSGISTWKKCIIFIAGIAVNVFLAFLFCLIYSSSFPSYYVGNGYYTSYVDASGASHTAQVVGLYTKGSFEYSGGTYEVDSSNDLVYCAPNLMTGQTYFSDGSSAGYIIDSEATLTDSLTGKTMGVVALYNPGSANGDNDFLACLSFYGQSEIDETYASSFAQYGVYHLPDFSSEYDPANFNSEEGETLTLTMSIPFIDHSKASAVDGQRWLVDFDYSTNIVKYEMNATSVGGKGFSGSLICYYDAYWAPFGTRLANGCRLFANFFPAFGAAIAELFAGSIQNIGGVVAMGATINQSISYMGIGSTFFLYGGFLSLNVAIFNLLPFPGLDGWQLLVAIIEGISRKKVPQKAKSIVSMIGICLLFVLAIFVTVKDVLQLVG